MRTLTFECEDPRLWLQDHKTNGVNELEYQTAMVNCAKSSSAESIMECIPPEWRQDFKDYVRGMAELQDESELISINMAPAFGLKEVRKLADWLAQNPHY